MKKSILLLAAIFCMTNIFAAITVTAKVKVLVKSASSISGDFIMMVESPDLSSGRDNSYDGPKNPIAGNLQMWVPASFGDMGTFGTNDLEGTPITVQTIGDEEYTFSFSGVDGRELKFYDKELNKLTVINSTNTYVVTLDKNTTIANRFFIYKPGEFKVCTTFDHVELYDNAGTDNIVITNMAGDTVVNVAPVAIFQTIDLSGKDAGHYVLTVNGTDYEFCNKPVSNN